MKNKRLLLGLACLWSILCAQNSLAFNPKEFFTKRCTSCHTVGQGTLVGPDLKDVTKRRKPEWISSFIRDSTSLIKSGDPQAVALFKEFNQIPMPEHKLKDDEVLALIDYIKLRSSGKDLPDNQTEMKKAPAAKKTQVPKPIDPKTYPLALFIILVAIGLLDFIRPSRKKLKTPLLKNKLYLALILLSAISIIVVATVIEARLVNLNKGYAPTQPIAFSHQKHAGDNQIACMYCHFAADRGRHAGIPPTQLCMNCHSKIKNDSAEIQKIEHALASGHNIRWTKVHHLPDFVYFNHSQHVSVAKLDCQKCHGPVETMEVMRQENDLSMGWCISCHRDNQIAPPNDHKSAAGGDCSKCHY